MRSEGSRGPKGVRGAVRRGGARRAGVWYEEEGFAVPGTVFSCELVVFRLEQRQGPPAALDLRDTLALLGGWREALISRADGMAGSVREIVSGHDSDGAPLKKPHLALMPLAVVGHPRADGQVVGVAAAVPEDLDGETRRAVTGVLAAVEVLKLGKLGVWGLAGLQGDGYPWDLRPEAWTGWPGGASRWSTVTPVAFDRHPKAKDAEAYHREVAEMIAAGCVAVGLPRPREVVVTPVSAHLGVPPAHLFPRLLRKDGGQRCHTHAILVFAEPVRGPVLIGAGRYRGYGVFRPLAGGAG